MVGDRHCLEGYLFSVLEIGIRPPNTTIVEQSLLD